MDPQAFSRIAEREFHEHPDNGPSFKPRLCDYMILKHMKNSQVVVEQGTISGDNVVSLVDAELDPETMHVVKIIFTPARSTTDPFTSKSFHVPLPFEKKVFKYISDRLHFPMSCFEPNLGLAIRRILCGEVTSFFSTYSGNQLENNIRAFVSFNNKKHVTTMFVHGALTHELEHIRTRLLETCMLPLTIHPLILLVIHVEEIIHRKLRELVRDNIQLVSRLPTLSNEGKELNLESEAREAIHIEHMLADYTNCWESLECILEKMLVWAEEIEISSLPEPHQDSQKEANIIICHHLNDLQDTAKGAQSRLRKVKAYNGVHRQMIEVRIAEKGNRVNLQIAAQSRDIALDSRRDASAMKAIAVLTMLFLPGTFISACFAMPLFDWDAPTASSVVNSRFWIYVVLTIPTTVLVLISWRLWYRFGEWKQWQDKNEQGTSSALAFTTEFYQWLRTGRPTHKQKLEGEI